MSSGVGFASALLYSFLTRGHLLSYSLVSIACIVFASRFLALLWGCSNGVSASASSSGCWILLVVSQAPPYFPARSTPPYFLARPSPRAAVQDASHPGRTGNVLQQKRDIGFRVKMAENRCPGSRKRPHPFLEPCYPLRLSIRVCAARSSSTQRAHHGVLFNSSLHSGALSAFAPRMPSYQAWLSPCLLLLRGCGTQASR